MKLFHSFKRLFNQDRDLKLTMIRREMVTDTLQIGIKFLTYTLSGSQAVKAEMCRSALDVINHVFRVSASLNSTYKPDDSFNYGKLHKGYSRMRHLTIIAPGYMFITSGLYHVLSSTFWLVSSSAEISYLTLNAVSLSAIGFASLGEFFLYYKNLGDVNQDKSQGVISKITSRTKLSWSIFSKAATVGPVQDTVLIENILSVTSATIPIFTSLFAYASGMLWIDLAGQFVNGGIQIFLGFRITKENSQILMLKSLKKKECEKIVELILNRKEIEKVENLKTSWNIDQLRISAEIKLDKQILAKMILKMVEKDMEGLEIDQKELREVMTRFCYLMLGRSVEICRNTEKKIQEVYEFARIIDIEKADSLNDPDKRRLVASKMDEVLTEEQNRKKQDNRNY